MHGKGEGILQKGIHEYLRDAPSVADYGFAVPGRRGLGQDPGLAEGVARWTASSSGEPGSTTSRTSTWSCRGTASWSSRAERFGEVVARFRHDLRRGAAAVRRVPELLRPAVPGPAGQARRGLRSRGCLRRSPSSRKPPTATRAPRWARSPRSTTTCACCSPGSACPTARSCGREIREQSVDQIVDSLLALAEGTRLTLLAPVVADRKGGHQKVLEDARRLGLRARAGRRGVRDLGRADRSWTSAEARGRDRGGPAQRVGPDARSRMGEGVETALEVAGGHGDRAGTRGDGEREVLFSQRTACPTCGISVPELEPRLFSFNNPFGACPECSGLGVTLEFDPELVIPDRSAFVQRGRHRDVQPQGQLVPQPVRVAGAPLPGFSLDTPLAELPARRLRAVLRGDEGGDPRPIRERETAGAGSSTLPPSGAC